MRRYPALLLLFLCSVSFGQPLRDINYAYQYDPDQVMDLQLRVVRLEGQFVVLYNLQVKDTARLMTEYVLQWEGRNLLSDRDGKALVPEDAGPVRTRLGFQGRVAIAAGGAPRYLLAKVLRNSDRRSWWYYVSLEPNYPVNGYLVRNGMPVTDAYIHAGERVTPAGDSAWTVTRYRNDFPAAAPAFSEAQGRVSKGMSTDSVFVVPAGEEITFSRAGLYLVQKDTNATQGLAFRVEEDYPQYTRLVNLPGPLVYITTKQEYDRLEGARGNKKVFDRVILGITQDTDRARTLMRTYFRRVELANRYFTSYKEGWKTDRGMVYIIFGKPDEVFRFNDREVWGYKNNRFDLRLTFVRSASLFDPDNYVLLREKRYEDTWYTVVDLWRNARF